LLVSQFSTISQFSGRPKNSLEQGAAVNRRKKNVGLIFGLKTNFCTYR
jgi:hypothetical protein